MTCKNIESKDVKAKVVKKPKQIYRIILWLLRLIMGLFLGSFVIWLAVMHAFYGNGVIEIGQVSISRELAMFICFLLMIPLCLLPPLFPNKNKSLTGRRPAKRRKLEIK